MKIPTSQESGKGSFERPHLAEGLYQAELKEVKDIKEGQYGPRVAFIFSVDAEGESKELAYVCYVPKVANPDNKFGQALQSLGVDLGQEVDTSGLTGVKCRVMVEDFEDEDESGNKKKASTISKVKPLTEQPGEQ